MTQSSGCPSGESCACPSGEPRGPLCVCEEIPDHARARHSGASRDPSGAPVSSNITDGRPTGERYGRLIGVSLGPGDPGLITRRGWELLNGEARWTYPVKKAGEVSYALDIALRAGLALPADAVALVFPMTTNAELLARAWLRAAADTVALLAGGRDVLFLVEGDASTYSTFGHLARAVRELQPAVEVEVIAGVSSFCASAARVGRPIADADETLAVFPASYGIEVIDRMLDEFDSLVLLKVKPMLEGVLDLLERRDLARHAVYVEKVGTPDERVVEDVLTLRGESIPYLSLMLLKNPGRGKPATLRGCRGNAQRGADAPGSPSTSHDEPVTPANAGVPTGAESTADSTVELTVQSKVDSTTHSSGGSLLDLPSNSATAAA